MNLFGYVQLQDTGCDMFAFAGILDVSVLEGYSGETIDSFEQNAAVYSSVLVSNVDFGVS